MYCVEDTKFAIKLTCSMFSDLSKNCLWYSCFTMLPMFEYVALTTKLKTLLNISIRKPMERTSHHWFPRSIVAEVNLQAVLAHRFTIQAAGLRNRCISNKAEIVSEVEKNVWPDVAVGKVKSVIYTTFLLCEAAEAHRLMDASTHIGKILPLP
ncbi:hypothetical protein ZEAMMB73_Zm00001d041284 [Zea mays]|uniref:Uncharacterized protein n=1 Tax=Zea mays TaxID=4577 RepID=A0A1D6MVE2_MAIZE|nr:hypothetical protein ZEAMMB73_Zm00001d041284 [Zea mays]